MDSPRRLNVLSKDISDIPRELFAVYTAVLLFLFYFLAQALYRYYFCPAAGIPGPLLAKLTFWYEFYYDFICTGQYGAKIQDLHRKYGSIVRINPDEVHILDADFYDQVYTGATQKRNKWSVVTNSSGVHESAFGTVDHDTHRMRRAALNPYFSKAKVRSLQPRIEEVLDKLMRRFEGFQASGEPLPLSLAYAALTNDIVMKYSFLRDDDRVGAPDFDPSLKEAGESGARMNHLTKQMPWILPIMKMLPDRVQTLFDPSMASYIKLNKTCCYMSTNGDHLFDDQDVIALVSDVRRRRNDSTFKTASHPTIFHEILNSNLPESEKSVSRLWQDGQVVVLAGTLTTATALAEISFHLLEQPDEMRKLKAELSAAIPDPSQLPPVAKLEQLPYLTAIIKEGLRLSNGISTRLQRVPTEETLMYTAKVPGKDGRLTGRKQYALQRGTVISMTGMMIHLSPDYFDDPMEFRPQRWISNPELAKYFVPFARGTRQCAGINLAYAELYLALAAIFRRYGSREVSFPDDKGWLELYQTTRRDLEIVGDGVTPIYRPDSKGVRVQVRCKRGVEGIE